MSCIENFHDYPFNTKIQSISWLDKNKHHLHRSNDLPAQILFFENGDKHKEIWYENGRVSRLNKPAIIEFFEKKKSVDSYSIKRKDWFINDIRHREDNKPAVIEYYENGKIKNEEWFIEGYHTKGVNSSLFEVDKNKNCLDCCF